MSKWNDNDVEPKRCRNPESEHYLGAPLSDAMKMSLNDICPFTGRTPDEIAADEAEDEKRWARKGL